MQEILLLLSFAAIIAACYRLGYIEGKEHPDPKRQENADHIKQLLEKIAAQNEALLKLWQPDDIRIPTCWTEGTNKVPDCGTVTAASTKPTDSDRVLTPKKKKQ